MKGLIICLVSVLLLVSCASKQDVFQKQLVNVANELNKTCPFMVDAETRLDNSIVLPNKTLQYNYTLVNIEVENVDVPEIEAYLKPNILNNVKTNPDLALYRDNNATLAYSYKDKNAKYITKLMITPEMYK